MDIKYQIACMAAILSLQASAQIELGYGSEPASGWGDANSVVTPYVSFSEPYAGVYAGNSLTSVSIAVMEEATNVYVYIKNRPDDQKYIYRQKVEKLNPGWNEIILETPFSISEGAPIAIGYKASFAKAGGVAISAEKNADADYIYYNSQNRWTTTGGSICIKATVDGDMLPTDLLMLSPIKTPIINDKMIYISGTAKNVGNNDITSCVLQVKVDGEISETIEAEFLDKGKSEPFIIDVMCEDYGIHTVTLEVTEVNGKDTAGNPLGTASATVTLKPAVYVFSRRIVCEEYTGTWCGFCPRGMVGLEMMREKYGEHFIPIAIHGGDPMAIDDEETSYNQFIETVSGAPYCKVNRQYSGDPYYDIQSLFNLASNSPLPLAVDAECSWNEDRSALDVTTTYLAGEDIANPKYNIVYTVTESGITGYAQTNYYAGGKNGELAGWEDKTDPTMDVVYNDVARALIGGYDGMECRYEPMESMMPYTHSISIPLPANVKNPDKIKVIAQIIDTTSGRIVNAAEAVPTTTGVEEIFATDGIIISPANGGIAVGCAGNHRVWIRAFGIDGHLVLDTVSNDGAFHPLPKGIYVVEATDASGINYRKKIKI